MCEAETAVAAIDADHDCCCCGGWGVIIAEGRSPMRVRDAAVGKTFADAMDVTARLRPC